MLKTINWKWKQDFQIDLNLMTCALYICSSCVYTLRDSDHLTDWKQRLFLFFCYFYYLIFSLPWGVGFVASVGTQHHYSEQLQDGTVTPFSGFHLLHWEIINNELMLSAE